MSARVKRVKLFGEGMLAKSATITRQRRLNVYLEIRKDGDKATIMALGTPGLALAFNAGSPLNNPSRGMLGTDTALYNVTGNALRSFSSTGAILQTATIGSNAGRVEMALNPTQILLVDGSAGYIFTPATGTIAQIGAAFPNGAQTATYCNGFFVCEQPGTNQFFVSNFNDGTIWNGLSFASAVQAIDGIKACDTLGGLLIVFSSGHLEFWQNAGLTVEPFTYIQNSASMYGLAAIGGRVHAAEQIVFLARTNGGSFQNSAGSYQFVRIKGYSTKVISTTDIDNILQTMARTSTIADCTALSYQQDEHVFAQFNFPTANRSLLLDLTTELWSEVQSGITPGYAARHLGNYAAGAFGKTYVADYANGNLYNFDPTVHTDNANPIVREIVSRTAVEDFNSFRVSEIFLDFGVGLGTSQPSDPGYDPYIELSVSRDNRNFGAARFISSGKLGHYNTRVRSRRWGRVQSTFALKIRTTFPIPFVLTGGAMRASGRTTPRKGS